MSYLFQVTWREEERRIDGARRSHDRVSAGPWIHVLKELFNGLIAGDVAHIGALDHRRRRRSRASIA